jgi:hypothetical protein
MMREEVGKKFLKQAKEIQNTGRKDHKISKW